MQPAIGLPAPKSNSMFDLAPGHMFDFVISGFEPELMHGSNFLPNRICSWILCVYSKYLMQRNPSAQAIVSARQAISPRRWFNWAQRTAHAAVSDEKIRTA